MSSLPNPILGAVIAACVTALVSLLGLVISKEQKTSEFRQAWIDALRADISAVIAHTCTIHGATAANFDSPTKQWEVVRQDYMGINMAGAAIRLRLNPNEKESIAVLKSLEQLEAHINPGELNSKVLQAIHNQLVADAQLLLKKEWLRVRSGELFFRTLKYILVAVIAVGIIFLMS